MSNNLQRAVVSTSKLPMMLSHLTTCNFSQDYMSDEELFENATFSANKKINIGADGIPLHCALFKSPPTAAFTAGKWIPSGYTSTGKYKSGKQTLGKMDKRAGQ